MKNTIIHEIENIQMIEGNVANGNHKDIENFVNRVVSDLNISEQNRPRFISNYSWQKHVKYRHNTLVILYFPDVKRIYFVEELI